MTSSFLGSPPPPVKVSSEPPLVTTNSVPSVQQLPSSDAFAAVAQLFQTTQGQQVSYRSGSVCRGHWCGSLFLFLTMSTFEGGDGALQLERPCQTAGVGVGVERAGQHSGTALGRERAAGRPVAGAARSSNIADWFQVTWIRDDVYIFQKRYLPCSLPSVFSLLFNHYFLPVGLSTYIFDFKQQVVSLLYLFTADLTITSTAVRTLFLVYSVPLLSWVTFKIF